MLIIRFGSRGHCEIRIITQYTVSTGYVTQGNEHANIPHAYGGM